MSASTALIIPSKRIRILLFCLLLSSLVSITIAKADEIDWDGLNLCRCNDGQDCIITEDCYVESGTVWGNTTPINLTVKRGATIYVKYSETEEAGGGGLGGKGGVVNAKGGDGGEGGDSGKRGKNGTRGDLSYDHLCCECEDEHSCSGDEGKGGRAGGNFTIIANKIVLNGTIIANGEDGKKGCDGDRVGYVAVGGGGGQGPQEPQVRGGLRAHDGAEGARGVL